jgi:hypothetical protein
MLSDSLLRDHQVRPLPMAQSGAVDLYVAQV